MRTSALVLTLIGALALPLSEAQAQCPGGSALISGAGTYQVDGGGTFSFQALVPKCPTPDITIGNAWNLSVPATSWTLSGSPTFNLPTLFWFYLAGGGGGFDIVANNLFGAAINGVAVAFGPVLFGGSLAEPELMNFASADMAEFNQGGGSLLMTSFSIQVVPEPATMVLLGTGLAGIALGGIVRRRRATIAA